MSIYISNIVFVELQTLDAKKPAHYSAADYRNGAFTEEVTGLSELPLRLSEPLSQPPATPGSSFTQVIGCSITEIKLRLPRVTVRINKGEIMKIRRHYRAALLICSFIIGSSMAVFGQNTVWSTIDALSSIQPNRAVQRHSFPQEFKLFGLNRDGLDQRLFSVVDRPGEPTIISLPNADGRIEEFELFEASNFDPELQAKYPDIRSFSGRGVTDRARDRQIKYLSAGGAGDGIQKRFRVPRVRSFRPRSLNLTRMDRTVYAVFRSARKTGRAAVGLPCSDLNSSFFHNGNSR